MLQMLSHPLVAGTPVYMENPPLSLRQRKNIVEHGNNGFLLTVNNHLGTHVDVPYHFHSKGSKIGDFPIDRFVFNRPFLLDLPLSDGELGTADQIEAANVPIDTDLLLVRTGFGESCRANDPARYGQRGPGLAAAVADLLRNRLPSLRAIAVDAASFSSPLHAEEGRQFHRAALDETSGRPLFLIEDVRLDRALRQEDLRRIVCAPLYIAECDGAPVTVIMGL